MAVRIASNKHACQPHPYQDKKYGAGVRVMNETASGTPKTYRCTVCGKTE